MEANRIKQAISSFDLLRSHKHLYRQVPIDRNNEFYNEPTVGIYAYGISGQSYYSRPNLATPKPLTEIQIEPMLRTSVVERLAYLNNLIKNDNQLAVFFGGPVELFVEEGLRSYATQQKLYQEVFPSLLREQFPGITSEEISLKLKDLIAEPSINQDSPSPHSTGAAFDITLRYFVENNLGYIHNQQEVALKRFDADVSEANFPDFFEVPNNIQSNLDSRIRENRRIFYSLMTGDYFCHKTDFECNPTEWWHWSYGDQLWAYVAGHKEAVYSSVN